MKTPYYLVISLASNPSATHDSPKLSQKYAPKMLVFLRCIYADPMSYTGYWVRMPFIERRIPWLILNDMSLFYEDAGMSSPQLASRFGVRKERVRNLLKRMGVELRKRGEGISYLDPDEDKAVHHRPRSHSVAVAFMLVRNALKRLDINAEIAFGVNGAGVVIDFADMKSIKAFVAALGPIPVDHDSESLYRAIQSWSIKGNLVPAHDEESEIASFGIALSLTLATRDLVTVASLVTS